jgi:hypothetical protein
MNTFLFLCPVKDINNKLLELMSIREKDSIALVEFAGSHDECLYSQLYALSNLGKRVILVCNPEIRERNPHFESLVEEFISVEFSGSKFKNNKILRGLLKRLSQENVSKVVLNTAQGGKVRNLCLMSLFSRIEFIGIIHTTRKFQGSFTQKIINWKVKKYLLLSNHLTSTVVPPKGIAIDYFYPIRYQGQAQSNPSNSVLEITIVGGVENRRKDLDGFIKMASRLEQDVNFTFLGKSDPAHIDVQEFQVALEKNKLTGCVKTFDHFVSQEEFNAQLMKTDAILPLVHPNTQSADQYFKNQISGAMSVAFGYKIPMLIHEYYNQIEEMKGMSIYYNSSNFSHRLSQNKQFEKTRKKMEVNPLIDVDAQEKRYLNFLFDA